MYRIRNCWNLCRRCPTPTSRRLITTMDTFSTSKVPRSPMRLDLGFDNITALLSTTLSVCNPSCQTLPGGIPTPVEGKGGRCGCVRYGEGVQAGQSLYARDNGGDPTPAEDPMAYRTVPVRHLKHISCDRPPSSIAQDRIRGPTGIDLGQSIWFDNLRHIDAAMRMLRLALAT